LTATNNRGQTPLARAGRAGATVELLRALGAR